jgi:hypothetical protein
MKNGKHAEPHGDSAIEISAPDGRYMSVLLDSGAFSAWLLGGAVDIDEYIAFILKWRKFFDGYVNLDVIPGRPGHFGTPAEIEKSAQQSYENLQYMKSKGLSPLPVFHRGESFKWLERLLADGEPYVGIAPRAYRSTTEAYRRWLDDVFTVCTDSSGKPIVKTHGFGVTAVSVLFRYPFFSADSITWRIFSGHGLLLIPPYIDGKPCFTRMPMTVSFAGRRFEGKSYWNLAPAVQRVVERWLVEEVGVSIAEARNDPDARAASMIVYLKRLGDGLADVRFEHRRSRLHI